MNFAIESLMARSHADRLDRMKALLPDVRSEAPPVTLDGTTARIRMYQSIDDWGEFWGLSANELADAVDALPSNIDTIELAINSPGGFVFESIAMVNALRRHPAKVVAVVDGIAASAASFIAASADETWMMPNSMMMLHAPWALVVGNAKDLRENADVLDELTVNASEIYAAKTGETAEEWFDRLAAGDDLYYSADEAVEAGLADGVKDSKTDDDQSTGDGEPEARFDSSLTLALLDL